MNLRDTNYNIHDLKDINFNWFLPDIQREFVWLKKPSDRRIENLFDSILKGYPIGNFLMWKIRKDEIENQSISIYKFIEEFNPNDPHNPPIEDIQEDIKNDEFSLVLDGQQRLTALYIGFVGKYYKKSKKKLLPTELYLNLAHSLNEQDPDDTYELEFLTTEEANRRDEGKVWFKIKDFLKAEADEEFVNKFPSQYHSMIYRLATKFLKRTFQTCVISNTNVDDALQLFVRLNSGGMLLKKTDLLMSFISARFQKLDIRQEINDLVDEWKTDGFPQLNSDKFLSTCMLMTGENAKFKVSDFKYDRVEAIEKNWNRIVSSVRDAIKLLKKFGYKDTNVAANIITSLALYIYKIGAIKSEDNAVVLKFIQHMQLSGFFRESTENQLNVVNRAMENIHSFKEVYDKLAEDLSISDTDIVSIVKSAEYSDPNAFALLQILFPDVDYSGGFGIDHIYPQKHFSKKTHTRGKVHKLFNLQILTTSENSAKNDIDPEEWIKGKSLEFRQKHFIPEETNLTWDEVSKFETERNNLLINKLQEVLAKN